MKSPIHIFRYTIAGLLLTVVPQVSFAAPPKTASNAGNESSSAKMGIPKSVFVLPTKPKEGRDPFFPDSNRPYEDAVTNNAIVPTDLVVKSIFGGLAVINNHSFAPGDVATVFTEDRRQVTLHCVAIDPDAKTVTVELGGVGGATIVLHFRPEQ